jgi:negative regulator of flagellin synthesis FlgM
MKVNQPVNNSVSNSESNFAKRGVHAGSTQESKRADRGDKSEKADKAEESSKSFSSPGAKAEISAKSREFSQAKEVAGQTPDVREDRVADLKKRISEGSYRVNEEELADRMVEDHLRGPGIR